MERVRRISSVLAVDIGIGMYSDAVERRLNARVPSFLGQVSIVVAEEERVEREA